ncbi:MAG TPA: hypothetical protein VFV58_19640 [Blastocatellia bacterium]|nr:hypothetical protein [Blastocatellia bacterium]
MTQVRTQETILGIVLTLLLSAAGAFAQEQIPEEKKKELRKFDPADIVPEAREGEPKVRERQVERGQVGGVRVGAERTQSRRNAGTSASAAPISAAVDSTVPIPPAAPTTKAPQSPQAAPSIAPKGAAVITQSAVTKTKSSDPSAPGAQTPATAVNRSARGGRMSLPLIFSLLTLVLLALGAIVVKLKRELQKP